MQRLVPVDCAATSSNLPANTMPAVDSATVPGDGHCFTRVRWPRSVVSMKAGICVRHVAALGALCGLRVVLTIDKRIRPCSLVSIVE